AAAAADTTNRVGDRVEGRRDLAAEGDNDADDDSRDGRHHDAVLDCGRAALALRQRSLELDEGLKHVRGSFRSAGRLLTPTTAIDFTHRLPKRESPRPDGQPFGRCWSLTALRGFAARSRWGTTRA